MLQVNPGIVTDNLIGYFDLNNKRCYPWDGSLLCKNLVNDNEKLSSFYDSIFVADKNKRYLNVSENNKIGGGLSARQLQNLTLQFWLKINNNFNFDNSINRLVGTQSLSSIATVEPITFEDEELTYDGEPINILVFNESETIEDSDSLTLFLNNTGGLGIQNSSLSPNYINTQSITFSGDKINKWYLITVVRQLSTITVYRDLYGEKFIYQDPSFLSKLVKVDGFQTFLNNFDINHVLIYNRALTKKEIFKNYNSFYPMYASEEAYYTNTAPNNVLQPDLSFILPIPPAPTPPSQICFQIPGINFKITLIYRPTGISETPPVNGTPPAYDVAYSDESNAYVMFGHWNTAGRWIFYPVGAPGLFSFKDSTTPYTVPIGVWSIIPGPQVPGDVTLGACP